MKQGGGDEVVDSIIKFQMREINPVKKLTQHKDETFVENHYNKNINWHSMAKSRVLLPFINKNKKLAN
jgi:hypothetical protein